MKLIDKLKNVFFEEVVEDEDEEELPQTFAKKIEVPKKKPEVFNEEKETSKNLENTFISEIDVPKEEKQEEPTFPMMFDDDDFLEDSNNMELGRSNNINSLENDGKEKELYHGKKELSYVETVRKPTFTYTKSYYEEKETKGFKPSPIISPIYGILDKNYKKEEVVTKKETHFTSGRTNFDLDSVRNKAFGVDDTEIRDKKTREKEDASENKKIYDVNNNKPQVNRVTLADADEYYNDLGLAYNVDYSDASRTTTRSSKYGNKENKKEKDVDDNLFDLIDSMYNKED